MKRFQTPISWNNSSGVEGGRPLIQPLLQRGRHRLPRVSKMFCNCTRELAIILCISDGIAGSTLLAWKLDGWVISINGKSCPQTKRGWYFLYSWSLAFGTWHNTPIHNQILSKCISNTFCQVRVNLVHFWNTTPAFERRWWTAAQHWDKKRWSATGQHHLLSMTNDIGMTLEWHWNDIVDLQIVRVQHGTMPCR